MIHGQSGKQKYTADDVIKVKKNIAERLRGVSKEGAFLQEDMYDFIWMPKHIKFVAIV